MRVILYPYKMESRGAKSIQASLREKGHTCLRIRGNGRYRYRESDLLLNWGNSTPLLRAYPIINNPDNVKIAQNKRLSFDKFLENGVTCPDFTESVETANIWLSEGRTVLCRTLLRASGGRGITLVTPEMSGLIGALLYVKYIKKRNEYRIHVFKGEIVHIQQKKRINGFENRNNQIRNHANGWVFSINDLIPVHSSVTALAIAAVASLGLDFGAVDIIWNERKQKAYVLEVNTAPGLEGSSINLYVDQLVESIL